MEVQPREQPVFLLSVGPKMEFKSAVMIHNVDPVGLGGMGEMIVQGHPEMGFPGECLMGSSLRG